ncbi:IS3 family transposase [Streptomyces malaysiensis]|uniref:IS3 family transposase n=1 Tax=Streptomyces malaysiensis TaxID=92644 RepID=UPI002B2C20DB|nr:IS3 family transposase [Streptomyces malaysiensis]
MTALIDEHPHLGAEPVLRELRIPSSTYYRWRRAGKEPCGRRRQDAELTDRIRQVHQDSGGIYGSPRVHAVLRREGVHVGRKRVERLMRQAGLAGISPRRGKGFTRRDPDADLAPDLVQCDFTAPAPNRLWVTDLTMISTREGPLWLSAIRDAFSRRVVAWETSAHADSWRRSVSSSVRRSGTSIPSPTPSERRETGRSLSVWTGSNVPLARWEMPSARWSVFWSPSLVRRASTLTASPDLGA